MFCFIAVLYQIPMLSHNGGLLEPIRAHFTLSQVSMVPLRWLSPKSYPMRSNTHESLGALSMQPGLESLESSSFHLRTDGSS